MDPIAVPLVDELASALNAAREELRRLHVLHTPHFEGKLGEPDLEVTTLADQAISRFEIERDRTDLDAATLPVRIVIALQDQEVTAIMTDTKQAVEVVLIDYNVPDDWYGQDMVSIPQTGSNEQQLAAGYIVRPGHMPERVSQIHRAVMQAGVYGANITEH